MSENKTETVRCVKVTRPETHGNQSCIYQMSTFSAADEFDGAEVGEKISLEFIELTREQYDSLGDFAGW